MGRGLRGRTSVQAGPVQGGAGARFGPRAWETGGFVLLLSWRRPRRQLQVVWGGYGADWRRASELGGLGTARRSDQAKAARC